MIKQLLQKAMADHQKSTVMPSSAKSCCNFMSFRYSVLYLRQSTLSGALVQSKMPASSIDAHFFPCISFNPQVSKGQVWLTQKYTIDSCGALLLWPSIERNECVFGWSCCEVKMDGIIWPSSVSLSLSIYSFIVASNSFGFPIGLTIFDSSSFFFFCLSSWLIGGYFLFAFCG